MKKFLLMSIVLFTISCTNKLDVAKKLIKEYMFNNLNDFKSYEPVNFSSVDSLFSTPESIPEYATKKSELDTAYARFKLYSKELKEKTDSMTLTEDDKRMYSILIPNNRKIINNITPYIDSVKTNFKKEFLGFYVIHKFRTNVSNGNSKLVTATFIFDKEMKKVVDFEY